MNKPDNDLGEISGIGEGDRCPRFPFKERYRNGSDAQHAIRARERRRKSRDKLRSFRCDGCDGFHLTKSKAPRKQR